MTASRPSDLLREPLDAIRRVQDAKLRRMLELCSRGHDFYRERWSPRA